MSAAYGADVWWEKQELEAYFVELYGREEGQELYAELMDRLSEGDRELEEAVYTTVWGSDEEIVLGQPEMRNHLIYSIEDDAGLAESVYDGGLEALRDETGYRD